MVVGPETDQLVLGERLRGDAGPQGAAGGQAPARDEHPGQQLVLAGVADGPAEKSASGICARIARVMCARDSSVFHNAPPSGRWTEKSARRVAVMIPHSEPRNRGRPSGQPNVANSPAATVRPASGPNTRA